MLGFFSISRLRLSSTKIGRQYKRAFKVLENRKFKREKKILLFSGSKETSVGAKFSICTCPHYKCLKKKKSTATTWLFKIWTIFGNLQRAVNHSLKWLKRIALHDCILQSNWWKTSPPLWWRGNNMTTHFSVPQSRLLQLISGIQLKNNGQLCA